MLEKVDLKAVCDKDSYKKKIGPLKEKLASLDQPIKEARLPVIILFEGWEGAGKGHVISKLILNFDPRWFTMVNTLPPTTEELREPMMWRHWKTIPEAGQMSVMDRSWYQEVSTLRMEDHVDELTNLRHMNEINNFERGLVDNGYLIIKIFLHISRKEIKKRLDKLKEKKSTRWRVTEADERSIKDYDHFYDIYEQMLEYTNTPNAPWHVVSATDERNCTLQVFQIVADEIATALALRKERDEAAQKTSSVIMPGQYHFLKMPDLKDISLAGKSLTPEKYDKELKKEQERLSDLHNRIYLEKIPVIIAYEGWDAAGKGGNIKRVSAALDPRGYEVMPIASPSREEKNRHFLWRFWIRLPKDGHVAIFDRTWYGRVMVERIEGFCTPADWQRAYGEINDFERQLYDWGAVILKFWIHIDNDEQLRRFNDRQNTPAKQWKITDEDWRNREKWPQYEEAVDDMLRYTSTDFAPWHVIEGNDKYYARVKTLKIINEAIESRLAEGKKRKR
ncbi:MAG: polyphosphate:AMP phosphotransferase [Lachnospiraceae bacterium]|nr:polyphosphate:AMP phosphotransferase [Lachnospiraceae bacterium]